MNINYRRWMELWNRLGSQGDSHLVYLDLMRRYSEPWRSYHTFRHIQQCLDEFKKVKNLIKNQNAVELAIWYHDAIYDSKSPSNEENSEILVWRVIRESSLPQDLSLVVGKLILATKHSTLVFDEDTKYLLDIDLSILGQDKKTYDKYDYQIHKEYNWVQRNVYAIKRTEVLKSFLDRPSIYLTFPFYNKYEVQARKNIESSIKRLCPNIR